MSDTELRKHRFVEDGQPYTGSIEALLPHRDPFLFVKKLSYVSEKKTIGEMTFDENIWFFKGHFPSYPVVPGVILVETMAQCGGAGLIASGQVPENGIFFLTTVNNVRFRQQVRPNDTVRMEVETIKLGSRMVKQRGCMYKGDTLCVEAEFSCVLASASALQK